MNHLSNTPKQIILYEALGFDIPKFYHVPMILNPEGKKLSKRDGAVDVMEYKREGYLPEALLNFLIRLGWSHGDQEIFSFEEMKALFDPNNINKSASAYNQEKLVWLNAHYIKQASYERLIEELRFFDLDISSHGKKELLIDALRDRAKTLVEFASLAKQILEAPTCYDEKAVEKFLTADGLAVLEHYFNALKGAKELSNASEFETFTKAFLEERGLKLKDLAQVIRIAMVGSSVSPSIFEVLEIIGYEGVVKRVEKLISFKGVVSE